jgi:hypothetical protein
MTPNPGHEIAIVRTLLDDEENGRGYRRDPFAW